MKILKLLKFGVAAMVLAGAVAVSDARAQDGNVEVTLFNDTNRPVSGGIMNQNNMVNFSPKSQFKFFTRFNATNINASAVHEIEFFTPTERPCKWHATILWLGNSVGYSCLIEQRAGSYDQCRATASVSGTRDLCAFTFRLIK